MGLCFSRRRFGNRSSQRTNASTLDAEEEASRSGDTTFCDENENVPEDVVFKRFTQDAVRKSNLSINSCVSVGSTMSAYGKKKRRAPQPPRRVEKLETSEVSLCGGTRLVHCSVCSRLNVSFLFPYCAEVYRRA